MQGAIEGNLHRWLIYNNIVMKIMNIKDLL